ncbi:hypothetical protein ACEWY4_003198 [Coilia grayii]|uniref:Ig-like domain-containing protein n=1 Tax=Coilia grayii TaxID=363190 RepID=A0ABD1KQI3_9TELE
MTPAPLLLLLMMMMSATTCVHGVELIQPNRMDVKPGQSFSISCRLSGQTVSDAYINWIRQSAGGAMAWIGWIREGEGKGTIDSLKTKISFSADTGSNTVFLQAQNFQAEDTAVYYCTRHARQYKHSASPYKNLPCS